MKPAWPVVALAEHLRVRHGFAFQGEHFGDHGDYIVLTPGNFFDEGGFKPKSGTEKFYRADPPAQYVLSRDDLVIAMTEQAQGLLGSSALIPCDGVYLHNQRIGLVEPVSDGVDRRFLYYLFNTRQVRDQIQATATGSKVRHTAPSRVESVTVALPPLLTQRKIAAALSAYDDLIENNTRRIKLMEEMAQRLFREWFVDFHYPGHEGVPFVNSELGPIPEGWTVRPLGEVVRQSRASVDPGRSPDEAFEHFSIPSYDADRRPGVQMGSTIRSNKFAVTEECVLYSKLNPRIPRVWLVAPTGGMRAVASTELLVLSASSHWNLPVIYSLCRSPDFADRVTGMAGGTSTSHQRVRPGDLLAVLIVDPGSTWCGRYSEACGAMPKLAVHLRDCNATLRATRDLLLPSLISGEIEVDSLNIDVPYAA